jgi:hypothetical protein
MRTTMRTTAARLGRGALPGVIAGSLLLCLAEPAQAALLGKSGQIVFSSALAGNREIASDGSARMDLTRDPNAVAFNIAVAALARAVNELRACGGRCPRVAIMRAHATLAAFGLIAQRVALEERCGDTYPLLQEHKAEQAMRAWARLRTPADRHAAVVTYGRYEVILRREAQGCWKQP